MEACVLESNYRPPQATAAFLETAAHVLTCSICFEFYSDDNVPKQLACQHTCCVVCLQNIASLNSGNFINCPMRCEERTVVPQDGVVKLKTNLQLKTLADEFHRHRATTEVINPPSTAPRNPNKLVNSKALSTLASNLGQEWEALAQHMGFAKSKLYHWKENNKYNVWGQVFAFLNAWKNSKGNSATIGRLISELASFAGVDDEAYRHLFFE